MKVLGASRFDQCAINMSLINICNQESHVGKEMRQLYNSWKEETDEPINNPWLDLHRFTIYVPHPDQEYENTAVPAVMRYSSN